MVIVSIKASTQKRGQHQVKLPDLCPRT